MVTVVELRDLTKRYGRHTAVDGVTTSLGEGEIYALLGLNGAGKTTTIRMMLGMVRATTGQASIFGSVIGPGTTSTWSSVGHLVETPTAYGELTVRENLEIARRLRSAGDPGAVDRVIDRLGLGPKADRRAATLSLGNAQRLGLAKALIHRPRLLILDEPANGLDPAGVVEIRDLLRLFAHNEGMTVFMSSHLLAEVALVADRVAVIHDGRMIEESTLDQLRARSVRRLVIGSRDAGQTADVLTALGYRIERADDAVVLDQAIAVDHPEQIATALVLAGCPPNRLVVEEESLEQQFFRIIGRVGDAEAAPRRAMRGM